MQWFRVMELMSENLNISWTMGLIKQQLTKLSIELRLSLPSLLPIALTHLRATPRSPTGLSPLSCSMAGPFSLTITSQSKLLHWLGAYPIFPF